MRNISFMLTTAQVLDGSKDVTRRTGWRKLNPGDLLCAVEKGMGLRRGEKVKRLAIIEVVSVRVEPLGRMAEDTAYGLIECKREGFGNHPTLREPQAFVDFFCETHARCIPCTEVTRIEFSYVVRGLEDVQRYLAKGGAVRGQSDLLEAGPAA